MTQNASTQPRQYCTFKIGDFLFGLPVEEIQEIIRPQPLTPVPLSNASVLGLMNLRGRVVTALSLRERLELPPREDHGRSMHVILMEEGELVSLVVDEISDVQLIRDDQLDPAPPTLQGPTRHLIKGNCQLPGKLVLVLDAQAILKIPSKDSAWDARD